MYHYDLSGQQLAFLVVAIVVAIALIGGLLHYATGNHKMHGYTVFGIAIVAILLFVGGAMWDLHVPYWTLHGFAQTHSSVPAPRIAATGWPHGHRAHVAHRSRNARLADQPASSKWRER